MDLAWNRETWNGLNWEGGKDDWWTPWGSHQAQWLYTVCPRLCPFLPCDTILEIGPGAGRWSRILRHYCRHLVLVDLAEKCIEVCRKRLGSEGVSYHVNDGYSLGFQADASVDLVFTFDSLVHAEADVLSAYIRGLAHVLCEGGHAFLHHSNLAQTTHPRDALGRGQCSQRQAAKDAEQAGLGVVLQELVHWKGCHTIDCFTILRRGTAEQRAVAVADLDTEQRMAQRWTANYHHDAERDVMLGFRLRREWLLDILGLGAESPDETQVETVNVRLEEMFREAIRDTRNVILVAEEDLAKLLEQGPAWRDGAKTMKVPDVVFDRDEGLADRHFRDLNIAPATLAMQLQRAGRLVFCHSPMLQYRREHRTCTLGVAIHLVYAPTLQDADHVAPQPPRVPDPDEPPRRRGIAAYDVEPGNKPWNEALARPTTGAGEGRVPELGGPAGEAGPEAP